MPSRNDDNPDDILTAAVPAPDDEPTAAERAHAKTFADLVDKTLAGRTPPAMSADDRALLEVATVIRAASGTAELPQARRHALVEAALRQAVGAREPAARAAAARAVPAGSARASVASVASSWRRIGRAAPWLVSGASALVAAAVVLLWLGAPRRAPDVGPATAALPQVERSRPADTLIGPIARARAGDAGTRIDAIFADRLDGYRELRFGGGR